VCSWCLLFGGTGALFPSEEALGDEAEDLALGDRERQVVDRHDISVGLAEM
jgi:hypothetical protein